VNLEEVMLMQLGEEGYIFINKGTGGVQKNPPTNFLINQGL
jgi:hypothetical protein